MTEHIECVINISEGRNLPLLEGLSNTVSSTPGARLLSCSSDSDHNRSVFTIAGSPGKVLDASWNLCRETVNQLDIRGHQGVHPRIGVVDVVPFVPLSGISMDECSDLAHKLGRSIGLKLDIPVFMYGEAALSLERANLANIRRGGLPALAERMEAHPADYGPSAVHPTAGAVAVGARKILVAYNIDLESRDLYAARRIAAGIRESNGGLPCVKALGLFLESRDRVQVSMNLIDYRRTPVMQVFETVRRLAANEGISVYQSEIVGHIPRAALEEADASRIKLTGFDPEFVYIEDRLESLANETF